MLPTMLVILTIALLYWFPIRRWMSGWGTVPSDLVRVMAGDALLPNHTYSATMAVIVDTPPEHIWPWLVQMGYKRGGLYSYDWLDRLFGSLDRPSADRILPEFQHLSVGDAIPLGRGPSWPVAVIEPCRALVLDMRNTGAVDWVWQFGLYPVDEKRTQLVLRSRVRAHDVWGRLLTSAIEPAGFVMTRQMLLGLKRRAERPQSSAPVGDDLLPNASARAAHHVATKDAPISCSSSTPSAAPVSAGGVVNAVSAGGAIITAG